MIEKDEAEQMVKEKVDTENLRKHMYAVSAIMERLEEELGKDRGCGPVLDFYTI